MLSSKSYLHGCRTKSPIEYMFQTRFDYTFSYKFYAATPGPNVRGRRLPPGRNIDPLPFITSDP
jgi:hypothetical protein